MFAVLVCFSSCSCTEERPSHEFVHGEDLMLSVDGRIVMRYDALTWQLGYNRDKKQFRVHNDGMSRYYTVTCSSLPTRMNQEVEASVKWASGESVTTHDNLSMKVVRIEDDGRLWLWNGARKIGVSVKSIR